MRITSLEVSRFRSFVTMKPIKLDQINVFVGPNNAGKSSLLKAIYLLQDSPGSRFGDVRLDASESQVYMGLEDVYGISQWGKAGDCGTGNLHIRVAVNGDRDGGSVLRLLSTADDNHEVEALPPMEPNHVIVPFFSRRKVSVYQEDVRESYALRVSEQFDYLAARLSRLGNPSFPEGRRYMETCEKVLGFVVTAVPSESGQRPGAYLAGRRALPLEQMGEGVPNIVGLLADLSLSKGKILLIEEPENDLHPTALKALLALIEESSKSNQIFVSTHSNIVVRYLGAAEGSRLFAVDTDPEVLPPVASVGQVDGSPEARLKVLRELGYSFSDFDLWDGWLILEEASAERIIRDYLIPWFAPTLSRLRTLSAAGNGNVEPTFDDFYRLARFTHLEPAYRNVTWVRVDGDDEGRAIVGRLQRGYPTWSADRFGTFSEAAFERYYPGVFRDRVERALAEPDRQARRLAKRQLLNDVRKWVDEDRDRAEAAFEESAGPVISDLVEIERQLGER